MTVETVDFAEIVLGPCQREGCGGDATVACATATDAVVFLCEDDTAWFRQMRAWAAVVRWFAYPLAEVERDS